jgi:site-specific DNA-methyltransferase (adenine-specific)
MNRLYYGDNIDVLRRKVRDESVSLCYIDPPFNSKRNYNQIYNNVGREDRAQAQAFVDTWIWDERAADGFDEILGNREGRFAPRLVELTKGLQHVLGEGSLLAYLTSMALRVTEIHRTLSIAGSFYLHCDPTASHYLKIVLDAIFCSAGGDFRNELVWCYAGGGIPRHDFPRKHDVILRYTKGNEYTFNPVFRPYTPGTLQRGRTQVKGKYFDAGLRKEGTPVNDWWPDVPKITSPTDPEKLGYPTQKPEALLERIISVSSNPGDVVMDAYCGCGTTVAVAERLGRPWIGMDISYQSISLVMARLEASFGPRALDGISTDGVPRDMQSAIALAHKKDDRLRKEFEKWAVLTYTTNRAVIHERKGADAGIDAVAYFKTGKTDNAKIVFQVKSGAVKRSDVATLHGDMNREGAALACLITLEEPTKPMLAEAKAAGQYHHDDMGRSYDAISIVTVKDLLEGRRRLEIPMSLEVLKAAQRAAESGQMDLL